MKTAIFRSSHIVAVFILLGLVITFGCQQPDPVQEATARLQPIVNAYVEVWNTGNVDTLDDIITPEFVRHAPTGMVVGLDSLKNAIATTRTAFPDFNVTIDEAIYIGDKSVTRWTLKGTNTGPGTYPPTGKPITGTGISITRYENGKVAEEWAEFNRLTTMQQLGFTIIPPAAEEK